jgi:hypothetical protein
MARRSSSGLWRLCPALLLLPLLSSGCSSFKKVLPLEIRTVEVERKIPVQNRPRPVTLNNIHFYVVTEDTFKQFKARFEKENGDFLFYALSVRDYETLALNMAELKRFLRQQKEIIVYYEKAVKPKDKHVSPSEKGK